MASAEFALVCDLKVRVGCKDELCVNSDADETLAYVKTDMWVKWYLTVMKNNVYIGSSYCRTYSIAEKQRVPSVVPKQP